MSLEAIRQEISAWDADTLRKLINYAVALHQQQSTELKTLRSQQLDDPNPGRWVSLEELDRRLQQPLVEED